jgi:hypothetical protein
MKMTLVNNCVSIFGGGIIIWPKAALVPPTDNATMMERRLARFDERIKISRDHPLAKMQRYPS